MVVVGAINSLLSYHWLTDTIRSSEGDWRHPTQGSLNQFQWGGRRSLVRGTCPPRPIPPWLVTSSSSNFLQQKLRRTSRWQRYNRLLISRRNGKSAWRDIIIFDTYFHLATSWSLMIVFDTLQQDRQLSAPLTERLCVLLSLLFTFLIFH